MPCFEPDNGQPYHTETTPLHASVSKAQPTAPTFHDLSSAEKFKLTLLTQCLSSVGVGYPSPLKT